MLQFGEDIAVRVVIGWWTWLNDHMSFNHNLNANNLNANSLNSGMSLASLAAAMNSLNGALPAASGRQKLRMRAAWHKGNSLLRGRGLANLAAANAMLQRHNLSS